MAALGNYYEPTPAYTRSNSSADAVWSYGCSYTYYPPVAPSREEANLLAAKVKAQRRAERIRATLGQVIAQADRQSRILLAARKDRRLSPGLRDFEQRRFHKRH